MYARYTINFDIIFCVYINYCKLGIFYFFCLRFCRHFLKAQLKMLDKNELKSITSEIIQSSA